MRILLTGGSGFIGTAVKNSATRRGHVIIPYDLPKHDVRDAARLYEEVRRSRAEAIINLAGVLGTSELFGHEAKAAEVNVIGAINAYDVASAAGIPVVQIGTGHKGQPNPYAITKACAEDLGLARARWTGQEISVVRAYHVYGPWQPVGPPHGSAGVHKFFPTFACRALTGMPLEFHGAGGQLIDPVYVDDCADVLVSAVNGPYGTVIEAGNGKAVTVEKVAFDIAAHSGQSVKVKRVAGRDGEPLNAAVVASRPACSNKWPYKVAETVEWYRQWLARS